MSARVPHNSHWGAFDAEIADGRLVGVHAPTGDPTPASFLASTVDAQHSSLRVRRPAVRRSWLERGHRAGGAARGVDHFIEVEWDEALDLVAAELRRVIDSHGNSAIFGGSYGWASAGRFHHAQSQLTRFLNILGGCTTQVQNYSYAAAEVLLGHILGSASMTSGEAMTWDQIEAHTDHWVAFGGVPPHSSQVESGGTDRHDAGQWLRRVAASGTTMTIVSPLPDDLPTDIAAQRISPRPGSDTAIILGLVHQLIIDGRADEGFLATHCEGWGRVKAYLLGAVDYTPKTLAWAAQIADVDPAELTALADRICTGRILISATWSLQRAEYGEQPFAAVILLAAALGQIGLPGGGFSFAYGNAALAGHRRSDHPSPKLPVGSNPAGSYIPVARIADMLLNPHKPYDYNGQRRTYPDTRLVYWAGGNPFHHHQDLNRLLTAWRRPETVIVHEPWWTATARLADIVLPASTTLERNDIGAARRYAGLMAMHQAVEPEGQARADFDIFAALAERLGVHAQFTEGRDEQAWLRHIYDGVRDQVAADGETMPAFDDFWTAGGFSSSRPPTGHIPFADFRADPDAYRLSTPSGRIELFSATIDSFGYDDCPGHATWLAPQEWLGSTVAQRFPLHMISNQPRTRLHSQLDMGRASVDDKIDGREPMRMNPGDAAARSLADGDVARAYNDRGSCLVGIRIDAGVRAGVVQLSTGAWFDPSCAGAGEQPVDDTHGNPNVLTQDRGTSRLSQGPSAHSALIEVEPYRCPLPPVRSLQPPVLEQRSHSRCGHLRPGQP